VGSQKWKVCAVRHRAKEHVQGCCSARVRGAVSGEPSSTASGIHCVEPAPCRLQLFLVYYYESHGYENQKDWEPQAFRG